MIGHIVERALGHVFMDLGLVVAVFAALEGCRSKLTILPMLRTRLFVATLLVAIVVAGREALDLHFGQVYVKVWSDWASHVVGLVGGWIAARWLIRKEWRS